MQYLSAILILAIQSREIGRARIEEQFRAEAAALVKELERAGAGDEARFLAAFAGRESKAKPSAIRWNRELSVRIGKFGRSHAKMFRQAGDEPLAEILENLSDHAEVFRGVNDRRRECDLAPVDFDLDLARACQLHCEYLQSSPEDGHYEVEGRPGYTEEGARAGMQSVLHYQPKLAAALDDWLSTLYHRIAMLHPNLKRIGTGQAAHPKGGVITALDVYGGRDWEADLPKEHQEYPPTRAANVRIGFPAGGENPDPLPSAQRGQAGNPVTVSFWRRDARVAKVRARLLEGGQKEIDCWVSSPDKPARKDRADNGESVCLIPKRPLRPRTTYVAIVECELDGDPFKKQWSFTTAQR